MSRKMIVLVLVVLSVLLVGCDGDGDKTAEATAEPVAASDDDMVDSLTDAGEAIEDGMGIVESLSTTLGGCSGKNGDIDRWFAGEITTTELTATGCNTTKDVVRWCDRTGGEGFATGPAVCASMGWTE